MAPVAFGDESVVEGGAGAGHVGLANLVDEIQLVVAAAVPEVQTVCADEG